MPKKKTPIKAFPKSQLNNKRVDKNAEDVLDKYERKVYKNPFDARKAADDEDRQNLKEIRAVEATQGMKMGGDAHASSCGCDSCMGESSARGVGSAIKGTGFKGVF
jgi:hypothetical protein